MQLERREYTGKNGENVRQKKWSIRFYDHCQLRRRIALFERKEPSTAFARRLERLVLARQGGEPLSNEMLLWVGDMPERFRSKLLEWKILDPRRISSAIAIEVHIKEWKRSLVREGRTTEHVNSTVSRTARALEACHVRSWGQVRARDLADWMGDHIGEKGWSARTHNSYVQSLRQFAMWMVRMEYVDRDLLISLRTRSMGAEASRRERCALTLDQARKFVHTTEQGGRTLQRISPATRGLAYRMAIHLGLRLGELAKLHVGWIQFGDGKMPTLIRPPVTGTKSSRRTGRRATLVVPTHLVERLREACAGRHPKAYLLPGFKKKGRPGKRDRTARGFEMMRMDLGAAGIAYKTDDDEFRDFHALRHTFLSLTASAGATNAELKELGRHSDLKVTQRYVHTEFVNLLTALERVPSLDAATDSREHQAQAVGAETVGPPVGPPDQYSPLSTEGNRPMMDGICAVDAVSPAFLNPSRLPIPPLRP